MKIVLTKKIGFTDFSFEVENADVVQAFAEANKIDRNIPTACGSCKKTNLRLLAEEGESEKGKFTFIKIKCLDCKAYKKLGQNTDKTKGWFFCNRITWNVDIFPETAVKAEETTPAPTIEEKDDNDLPF